MNIKMFTSSTCIGCKLAKIAFAESNMGNIKIQELNVEEQEGAMEATKMRISGGLPVFVNTDTMDVFSGWHGSIDKFKEWCVK